MNIQKHESCLASANFKKFVSIYLYVKKKSGNVGAARKVIVFQRIPVWVAIGNCYMIQKITPKQKSRLLNPPFYIGVTVKMAILLSFADRNEVKVN